MNKKTLIKRISAGVFYVGGILFALYITRIILRGNSIFNISGLVICALGVCIPIAIATFLLISSVQEVNKRLRIMKVCGIIIFIFYDILLINVLFWSGVRHFRAISTISITQYVRGNTNFIPFKTIGEYIRFSIDGSINKSIIVENLLGNILLFSPMGILIPCIFQSLRKFKKFLFVMVIILGSVEIGQLIARSGSCDIDDIILNLTGAILVYGLWNLNLIQKILRRMYVLNNTNVMYK
jgi:glycopeptide antibiotics resistance protein